MTDPSYDTKDSNNNKRKKSYANRPKRSERSKKRKRGTSIGLKNEQELSYAISRIEIVPFRILNHNEIENCNENPSNESYEKESNLFVRIVHPYPYTFTTYAKKRWCNRKVLEVYCTEFGSYPESYYVAALKSGRILVNGTPVKNIHDQVIRSGDCLSHMVHRHEPAVLVSSPSGLPVDVVYESDDVIVVDKPSTMPTHPCGGYHLNSLFHILTAYREDLKDALYPVHRLDRLTSGLTIIAKSSEVAKDVTRNIMERNCTKYYLARVRGKFPLNAQNHSHLTLSDHEVSGFQDRLIDSGSSADVASWISASPLSVEIRNPHETNRKHGLTHHDVFSQTTPLDQLFEFKNGGKVILEQMNQQIWFELSCPCRIASHKNGVCETSNVAVDTNTNDGWKPAHTSFTVISYDEKSDSSILLVKPHTGRTHQIRLHLQFLCHPIANDPNYGGDMWYANDNAKEDSLSSLKQLECDADIGGSSRCNSDTPATEEEIKSCMATEQNASESIDEFIRRTCVWCQRSKLLNEKERNILELKTRSHGIWLHALCYQYNDQQYTTRPPSWYITPSNVSAP